MTTEQKMTDAPECVRQLASHQEQLDQDGVMVGVSRQALDETLEYITRLREQLQWRPISEAPRDGTWIWAWSAGATRPAQVCWWDGEWKDDEMIDRPNYIAVYDRITHFIPLPPPPGGES